MNRLILGLCVLILTAVSARAQFSSNNVEIRDIRIGFKASRFTSERDDAGAAAPVAKFGFWAPVSFRLEVLRGTDKKLWVEIDSTDDEMNTTTTRWPLGTVVLNPNSTGSPDDKYRTKGSFVESFELESVPLVRLGVNSQSRRIQLKILAENDGSFDRVSPVESVDLSYFRDPSKFVIVSLGSKLASFAMADETRNTWESTPGLKRGRVETAGYDSVELLPDHWYGYSAADLIVLATGNTSETFLAQLFDDNASQRFAHKREALLEWVRRGGRLVISVGRKTESLQPYLTFRQFMPIELGTPMKVRSAEITFKSGNSVIALKNPIRPKLDKEGKPAKDMDGNLLPPDPPEPFSVVPLKSKPGQQSYELGKYINDRTLEAMQPAIQVPMGLGRITILAFDIDASPFVDIAKTDRAVFWKWLAQNAGSERTTEIPSTTNNYNTGPNYYTSTTGETEAEELAQVAIRRHVDDFEGVPVISFGWIAAIIILYTIIIGPLEYLFLKKILGRLELTWVTFPIIVITISAGAAYATHAIKGKDLRINKVDIIDYDLGGGRVYGRSWFSILSPRVDTYTIGIEGKEPWSFANPEGSNTYIAPESLIDWQSGMKRIEGSSGMSYRYALDPNGGSVQAGTKANGIERVPIKVYSTKAFNANWSGFLHSSKPPVESTIQHVRGGKPTGTITMNLPIQDVAESFAFYAGQLVTFDKPLNSGVRVNFDLKTTNRQNTNVNSEFVLDSRLYTGDTAIDDYTRRYGTAPAVPANQAPLNFWGTMFYEYLDGKVSGSGRRLQNASLRAMDQSWRLRSENVDEVILLIRLRRESGEAETMFQSDDSATPTRLWVKGLPGPGPRPPVPGKLQQDTYIRIYIPVKPAK